MPRNWDAPRFLTLLDEIRAAAGTTYEELGRLSPVSSSTLSRWRGRKVEPDFGSVVRLAAWVRARYPAVAAKAPELVAAAGFGAVDLDAYAPDDDGIPPHPDLPPELNAAYAELGERLTADDRDASGDSC